MEIDPTKTVNLELEKNSEELFLELAEAYQRASKILSDSTPGPIEIENWPEW
ncbi:MAG: hypothetical protein JNK65_03710 [Deltaproteobacteria bacterium]|nr:hypothetical protein [Deltaproteobacteria bacterium]